MGQLADLDRYDYFKDRPPSILVHISRRQHGAATSADAERTIALCSIGHQIDASEAKYHHRPSRGLGNVAGELRLGVITVGGNESPCPLRSIVLDVQIFDDVVFGDGVDRRERDVVCHIPDRCLGSDRSAFVVTFFNLWLFMPYRQLELSRSSMMVEKKPQGVVQKGRFSKHRNVTNLIRRTSSRRQVCEPSVVTVDNNILALLVISGPKAGAQTPRAIDEFELFDVGPLASAI